MCLIPKGPHRGKVLVWGATVAPLVGAPVLIRSPDSGPPLQSNEYWACAAWSIVDPSPQPAGPRFRNFLLPIETFTAPPSGTPVYHAASLFCAGQAWSPHGDLIVAGGTQFGVPTLQGPYLTYAWNPAASTQGWPPLGTGAPLYPGEVGLWQRGVDLQQPRFYPTVTLTARLARLGTAIEPEREVMIVAGGSVDDASPDPYVNYTWNTYEALELLNRSASLGLPAFTTDSVGGVSVWPGPGTTVTPPALPPVEQDWLEDYPRMHLLSTGEVLFSGYAPRWAKVDHDLAPGVWIRQASPPWSSTAWQHPRHDGTSVLFPNVGGLKDLVVRMGGADEINYTPPHHGTTATIEAWVRQGTGGFWAPAGDLPNPQPGVLPNGRYLMNTVILPDASLLVLGGVARQPLGPPVFVREPLLYKNGAWSVLPSNPTPSVRDYHSTAVLLPDGRVLLGGGNNRNADYEIYMPQYLTLPKPQNLAFVPPATTDLDTGAFRLDYNNTYRISFDALAIGDHIDKVVLMAPGATTHHFDMHQRYVGMTILPETAVDAAVVTSVNFRTPIDDKHAPRGIYMLFLVTSAGAVADALWVVLR